MTMRKILKLIISSCVLGLAFFFLSGGHTSLYVAAQQESPLATPNMQEESNTQADGTLRRIRIPILMYHYISEIPEDADDIRIGLTVTPAVFRQQIRTLIENNYSTVSLYEVHGALQNGEPLPQNPVILTFDDGHLDHYVTAFPILQEAELTGTFFIITNFADNNQPGYMNWDQIREMSDAGMNMESHTKTHSDLRNRSYDFLVYEIVGSIESLAYHNVHAPQFFSYPIGRYDENTLTVLETTDVLRAVTTQPGTWQTTDNALLMPRMRVTNEITSTGLLALLRYED